jgi:hypothetical protein
MSHQELNRSDKGEAVEQAQGLLNRGGAMLTPDGDFGGGTERGVRYAQDMAGQAVTGTVDEALWVWLEQQPEPFPPLATNGVALIAREETGGLAFYRAVTRLPHFPGASRREMRNIRDILAEADDPALHKAKRKMMLSDVEDEIVSMQRLWDPGSGLIKRRRAEANLWREGLDAW